MQLDELIHVIEGINQANNLRGGVLFIGLCGVWLWGGISAVQNPDKKKPRNKSRGL